MENSVRNSIMRCLERHAFPVPSIDQDGKTVQCAQLEPRTLFSTVPLDIDAMGLEEAIENSGANIAVAPDSNGGVQIADTVREVVFIDESVPDAEYLFDELNAAGTTAILIDSTSGGIEQISAHLAQATDLSAIHIISHGSDGEVLLGNTLLDTESLMGSASQVAEWQNALAEDADILFYGCDLASGEDGLEFLEAVGELTGADVAASDDVTGHESLGGDYDLEFATGTIQSGIVFDSNLRSLWQHSLAAPIVPSGEEAVHQPTPTDPDHPVTTVQNTSRAGRGSDSAVAISQDTGNYVVVYTSESNGSNGDDVFFQLFDAAGNAITDETKVNDDPGSGNSPGNQNSASVAMDDAGNFFITWVGHDTDGTAANIYAKFYNSDGSERTTPILVNDSPNSDTLSGAQQNPDIAVSSNGAHVSIAWDGTGLVGGQNDTQGAFARTFDAVTGAANSDSIRLNELGGTGGDQNHAVVAVDNSGVSFAAWNDLGQTLGNNTIVARKFDSAGNLILDEALGYEQVNLPVDTFLGTIFVTTEVDARNPSIDVNDSGSVVAISFDATLDLGIAGIRTGVIAQAFSGADLADNLDYSQAEGFSSEADAAGQKGSSIALVEDNATGSLSAILTWEGEGSDNGQVDNQGIWARKFDVGQNINDNNRPILVAASGDILVNQTIAGIQETASVAVNDVDNFVVAWSGGGNTDDSGVFARRFGTATITAVPDEFTTNEDTPITLTPLSNDVFSGMATFSAITVPAPGIGQGTFVTNVDGTLTFDPGSDFQHLLPGEQVIISLPYTITDGTDFSSANIELTITGENDAPVAGTSTFFISEDSPPILQGLATGDVDSNDTFTFGNLAFSGSDTDGITVNFASGSFSVDTSHYQYLPAGSTLTVSFEYDVTDAAGETETQRVIIDIVGENDAPVAQDSFEIIPESAGIRTFAPVFSDPDDGDTISLTGSVAGNDAGISFSGGSVIVDPGAYNYLNDGETETVVVNYTVTDGFLTDTGSVTVTITGENSSIIAGNVYEDILGDGSIAGDPLTTEVVVHLYRDSDGDNTPSANDTRVTTQFSTDGQFSFEVPGEEVYWVFVDSRSIGQPVGGFNGTGAPLWAEQTYAAAGAYSSALNDVTLTDGAFFGGKTAGVADDPLALVTSEHVIQVDLRSGPDSDGDGIADIYDVDSTTGTDANNDGIDDNIAYTDPSRTDVDFGFSFNVVTETHDNGGQGTLRQFIDNANEIAGSNELRFVPVTPANSADGTYWTIEINSLLPVSHDTGTTIDGTAYDKTDGTSRINSNSGFISSRHSRPAEVGVGGISLSNVEAPELEITNLSGASLEYGLAIEGDSTTVQHVAIHGFGTSGAGSANILVGNPDIDSIVTEDFVLFQSVIGTGADLFDAPNAGEENKTVNVAIHNAINGLVSSNLIGFAGGDGIRIVNSTGSEITGNEISSNAQIQSDEGGIDLESGSTDTTITANLIVGNRGFGFESGDTESGTGLNNNSIIGNGLNLDEVAGVRLSSGNNQVIKNVITENAGDGILVLADVTNATQGNLLSRNHFYGNAESSIDLADRSDERRGDGVTLNDGNNADGTLGNMGLDFPDIALATVSADGMTLTLEGTAPENTTVEFYVAQAAGTPGADSFGEGEFFLGSASVGTSGTFNSVINLSAPASADMMVTAIAIDFSSFNTSEFSRNVAVTGGNQLPVALDDTGFTTTEGTPLTINVSDLIANDSDVDGDTLTATIDMQPANGTVTDNSDGTFTYTPTGNLNGTDSFTYVVSDGNAGTATATVTIEVTPVNDSPVALDDSGFTTTEGTPLTITASDLIANDSDVDGDTLTATIDMQPINGTVTDNSDGTFTYTPTGNLNGTDSFTYVVSDGNGGTATATVIIEVTPVNPSVNNPPVALDDSVSTIEDTPLIINTTDLLSNDFDPESTTLSIVISSQPGAGTVVDQADGTWLYTPNLNFEGTDSFTYTVSDEDNGTNSATVEVTVSPVNDLPIANDDAITTNEDTPKLINTADLLSNDSDVEGIASISIASQPQFGTVVAQGDGTWLFTPTSDFAGPDSFTYTITDTDGDQATANVNITVDNFNDLPSAADDEFAGFEDTALQIQTAAVLSNDQDPDFDILTVAIISQPSNGTVFDDGTGVWTYTPKANFSGVDSFSYQLRDGNGGSSVGTVTINVAPVNDLPTAVANEFQTSEDRPLTILKQTLLANDFDLDGDDLVISQIGQPQNGTLVDNGDSIQYVPDADFNGSDNLVYQIDDGNGGTATASVRIMVTPVNDAPEAVDDNYIVAEGATLNVAIGDEHVLANDSDRDGDQITARITTEPEHGQLTLNANGSFVYVHDGSETTTDQFEYEVVDENGIASLATVTIDILPMNDAPVTNDDFFATREETVLVTNANNSLLNNDNDADGDPITTSLTGRPSNGTVVLNSNGTFVYEPNENFDGTDSFEYTATDVNGNSSTATVTIQVAPVNDIPVAGDETFTIENNAVNGNVLANDSDADGDELTVRIQRQPANGRVTLNLDGTFQYVPFDENSNLGDSFSYVVIDRPGAPAATPPESIGEVTINASQESAIPVNGQGVNDTGNAPAEGGTVQEAPLAPTDTDVLNLSGTNIDSSVNGDDDDDDDDTFEGTDPRANIRTLGDSSSVNVGEEIVNSERSDSSTAAATPFNRVVQSVEFARNSAQDLANLQNEPQVATSTTRLLEALSSNAFIEGLDSIVAPLTTSAIAPELMLESVVMATSTLSVGYFLWIVRTGYLVASCISASPAWQSYDPLPIMASVQNSEDDLPETDQDRELEAMMGVNPR